MIETVSVIVDFVGMTEFANVGLGEAVVLADGDHGISLKVFDFLSSGIVEVAEILAEFLRNQVDLAVDVLSDGGNSCVRKVFNALLSLVDVIDDSLGSFNAGFVDQDLVELHVGNSDGLGVSLINCRVKFDAVLILIGPVRVVDVFTVSNFGFHGFPVGNSTVEVAPSTSRVRGFEITVENEIVVGVGRSQSDVIDSESVTVTGRSTVQLEQVVAS